MVVSLQHPSRGEEQGTLEGSGRREMGTAAGAEVEELCGFTMFREHMGLRLYGWAIGLL